MFGAVKEAEVRMRGGAGGGGKLNRSSGGTADRLAVGSGITSSSLVGPDQSEV